MKCPNVKSPTSSVNSPIEKCPKVKSHKIKYPNVKCPNVICPDVNISNIKKSYCKKYKHDKCVNFKKRKAHFENVQLWKCFEERI